MSDLLQAPWGRKLRVEVPLPRRGVRAGAGPVDRSVIEHSPNPVQNALCRLGLNLLQRSRLLAAAHARLTELKSGESFCELWHTIQHIQKDEIGWYLMRCCETR